MHTPPAALDSVYDVEALRSALRNFPRGYAVVTRLQVHTPPHGLEDSVTGYRDLDTLAVLETSLDEATAAAVRDSIAAHGRAAPPWSLVRIELGDSTRLRVGYSWACWPQFMGMTGTPPTLGTLGGNRQLIPPDRVASRSRPAPARGDIDVEFEMLIGTAGNVLAVAQKQSTGSHVADVSLLAYMKTAQFRPAVLNGVPVSMRVSQHLVIRGS